MTSPPRHRTFRSGFTFVEVTIVILIMGILAAVAAPRYLDALDFYRGDAAAKRVMADLRLAQREAKRTSTNQPVQFFVASNRYILAGINGIDHADQTYEFQLDDSNYQSVLVSANFGGSDSFAFDIYGRPTSGGTIVIQSGSRQLTINVDENGIISQL